MREVFFCAKLSIIITLWYFAVTLLWQHEQKCWSSPNTYNPFIQGPYLIPLIISFMVFTWIQFLELLTRRADKWFIFSVQLVSEVGAIIYLITWGFGYQEEFPRCSIANAMIYVMFLVVFVWLLFTMFKNIQEFVAGGSGLCWVHLKLSGK